MPELVSEFLKTANIAQLTAIGIMFWFFYNRLEAKIDKGDARLEAKIEASKQELNAKIETTKQELHGKMDILANKIEDVDRRLCRIEGSLATQGHCLFGQKEYERKAE